MEVEKIRTPISATDAERELTAAWLRRFNEPIEPKVLRLLLALWDLETKTGESQFNHNYGNIIASSDEHLFFRALDSGNPRKFRSYADRSTGASGLVSQLTSKTRPHWHEGLLSGSPVMFARKLKEPPAYYEAPERRYLNTLLERWEKYDHLATNTVEHPDPKDDREQAPQDSACSPSSQPSESWAPFYIAEGNATLPTCRTGSRGQAVQLLQTLLGVKPDGMFQGETYQALLAFQSRSSLLVDGVCGRMTWAMLAREVKR